MSDLQIKKRPKRCNRMARSPPTAFQLGGRTQNGRVPFSKFERFIYGPKRDKQIFVMSQYRHDISHGRQLFADGRKKRNPADRNVWKLQTKVRCNVALWVWSNDNIFKFYFEFKFYFGMFENCRSPPGGTCGQKMPIVVIFTTLGGFQPV